MPRRKAVRRASRENKLYRDLLARIGANLRRLREAKGWTQEDCAFQCGDLGVPHLRRIELASSNITIRTLARLCEGLGVEPAELLAAGTLLVRRRPGRPRRRTADSSAGPPPLAPESSS